MPHQDDPQLKTVRSVDEHVVYIPPQQQNPHRSEIQFPIPAHKRKSKSKRRSKSRRPTLISPSDGGCCDSARWIFMDHNRLDAIHKSKMRTGEARGSPCYTYEEMRSYQNNCFYRNFMVGLVTGSTIYLLNLLFLTLSERIETFNLFRVRSLATVYLPTLLAVVLVTYLIRLGVIIYLNAYLVMTMQGMILIASIMGNYYFDCKQESRSPSMAGAGHVPLFSMGTVEYLFNISPDKLRQLLFASRCLQPLIRANSFNLLSEFVAFMASVRLIFV